MQSAPNQVIDLPYLRPKAAAIFLGYTEKTLASYRSRGIGPRYVKKGRRIFYRKEDLLVYITEGALLKTRADQPGELLTESNGTEHRP